MKLTYEDFFDSPDVATYKRVKRGTMALARIGRDVAAEIVRGEIGDGTRSGKEFVRTRVGLYRLSFGSNSDNTTERAAHQRMGAKLIVMGDSDQMIAFFDEHVHEPEDVYRLWLRMVREGLG